MILGSKVALPMVMWQNCTGKVAEKQAFHVLSKVLKIREFIQDGDIHVQRGRA